MTVPPTAPSKLEALRPVIRQNWSLVLCNGKKPVDTNWQHQHLTAETIAARLDRDPSLNVGVILGSNVIDLECDSEEATAELPGLFDGEVPRTPSYSSRRGSHYLFKKHPRLAALGKAKVKCGEVEVRLGAGGKAAQSLLPPSETDGFTREWIVSPDECELADLPEAVVDRILAAAAAPKPTSKQATPPNPDGSACLSAAVGKPAFVRPGADFNARGQWSDVLVPHGWQHVECRNGVDYWTRPGKDSGTSATTGFCKANGGHDLMFVFTTEAPPLQPDTAYDKFKAFALLNHRGDLKAAANELKDLGYGRKLFATTNSGKLVELASDFELFHTTDGEAYATIEVNGHMETHRIGSKPLKLFMQRLYHENFRRPISSNGLSEAMQVLAGQATFAGEEYPVHVRAAQHEGTVYVDLGNEAWEVVAITADGWRVTSNSPVKFRRPKGMLKLPTPRKGGSIELLRPFVRASDSDFLLLVLSLVAAFRGAGPYPIVILQGEHGSAKSTTARVCRSLVDPNVSPLRAEPQNGRDLMIAATNGLLIVFDNLSGLKDWLSDALCRLSTGGGFSCRELYENGEEAIFDAQRPVMLTGINNPVKKSDLLDRALLIELPVIPELDRKAEADFWAEFEAVYPLILGALFDGVAAALKNLPYTKLDTLPRMADFALWATAAQTAYGWPAGAFMDAYERNRSTADEVALDSPLAQAVILFMADKSEWDGSATDLFKLLEPLAGEAGPKSGEWPKSGSSLSGKLKELAPNLRSAGVHVRSGRSAKKRLVTLSRQLA